MQKTLLNFVLVLAAVLVGLFLYERFVPHPPPPPNDFGVGAMRERAAILRDDFGRAANGAKTAAAEYYSNSGKWPDKNADAGLPQPDVYKGTSLRRLDLRGNTITLTFDAQSGVDGGLIVLQGEATPNLAMGINWICVSPNIQDIHGIFPACTYKP